MTMDVLFPLPVCSMHDLMALETYQRILCQSIPRWYPYGHISKLPVESDAKFHCTRYAISAIVTIFTTAAHI